MTAVGQTGRETHQGTAGQICHDTQSSNAGHREDETQTICAGHDPPDTQLQGAGHASHDIHTRNAGQSARETHEDSAGQKSRDAHTTYAGHTGGDGTGHLIRDTHDAAAGTIAAIREHHRLRQDFHREEKALTLRIKAQARRLCQSDKAAAQKLYAACEAHLKGKGEGEPGALVVTACAAALPLREGRAVIHDARMREERACEKLAKTLPVWSAWGEGVRGFGPLSLAQIVGEAGDLSNYDNPAKLWKRMGLGLVNEGGVWGRQRKRVDPALAAEHGYSPNRRSIMYCIGESLVRAGGEFKEVYDKRKDYEIANLARKGVTVMPASEIAKQPMTKLGGRIPKVGGGLDKYMSLGHVHNRAKRFMEKRLLRELWTHWRQLGGETQCSHAPVGP